MGCLNGDSGQTPADDVCEDDMRRRIRRIEFKAKRIVRGVFSGEYHSTFRGRGIEFKESRLYLPGDDSKDIDWKITARTGKTYTKSFAEERRLNVLLLADMSASIFFGSTSHDKKEYAAEVCAALAFTALWNNDSIGLVLFTDRVEEYLPSASGRINALRIINTLLRSGNIHRRTDITTALRFVNKVVKKKCVAFLISDFMCGGYERTLAETARKHDLIAIRIYDERERALPDVGRITLADMENGGLAVVNTSDPAVRRAFEEAVEEKEREERRMFENAGVDWVTLRSGEPFAPPIMALFKLRERRLSRG